METFKTQIDILKKDLATYRTSKDILQERQGIINSLKNLSSELRKLEEQLAVQKEVTKELQKQREAALQSVCCKISTEIDKFLTEGEASIKIDEGKVRIDWIIDKRSHPIESLSQGERAEFLYALSRVLMPPEKLKINYIELAEAGEQAETILAQISQARRNEKEQTIACSWQNLNPGKEWKITQL